MGLTLHTGSALLAFASCAFLAPFVLLKGSKTRQTYLYSGLTTLVGLWCLFPFGTGQAATIFEATRIGRIIYLAALLVPPVFLHLTFAILDLPKNDRQRLLLWWTYTISGAFALTLPTKYFIVEVVTYAPFFSVVPGPIYGLYALFFGVTCAIGFWELLKAYRGAAGIRRNHLRYIFVSWFVAYIAGLLHFMPAYFGIEPFPHDILVVGFVTISAYAIIRYRLMDIRQAFTRATVFIMVYTLTLGLPLVGALSWQTQLEAFLGHRWWVWLLLTYAALATAAHYTNMYFQKRAEARLLAESHRYQAILRQASQGMTLIKELGKLLNLIVHLLTRKVRVNHAAVYLLDDKRANYIHKVSRQWRVETPPVFPVDSP
ncbi:MAG: hypothetical protein COV76_03645, partial [Candidatus Omnitrophica bacterium CG11_big_fil_rev_8_21_14_0_20_64_10]